MSWRPYVSAAERRAQAKRRAAKLAGKAKTGQPLQPIQITGRTIARTFWGKAWCDNLEAYSDYANRLPRGRTYARNGSIIDLQIRAGEIEAQVSGSDLYKVRLQIAAVPAEHWRAIRGECAGQINSLVELLQGQVSASVMAIVTRRGQGLFPAPKDITLRCSCPDWASMCKHVAATLYGVGARLDHHPELLFTLRGVDPAEMIAEAIDRGITQRKATTSAVLAVDDLAEIFGLDIDFEAEPTAPPAPARSADRPVSAQRVLDLITRNPGVRSARLAERLAIPRKTLRKLLNDLKNRGLIEFIGATRDGGYHPKR